MKQNLFASLGVFFCLISCGTKPSQETKLNQKADTTIKVTSFNVLFQYSHDIQERLNIPYWNDRRPEIVTYLKNTQASLYCLLESNERQATQIADGLNMDAIYFGSKNFPRENALLKNYPDATILYDKNLYTLKERGFVWLSPTPSEPLSRGFGNLIPRVLVWTKLAHKNLNTPILFGCVHSDNNEEPRENMMNLVASSISKLRIDGSNKIPAILAGDFNVEPKDPEYKIFERSGLEEVFRENKKSTSLDDRCIDHIFVSNTDLNVQNAQILNSFGKHTLSDHYAVTTSIEFSKTLTQNGKDQ